MHMEPMHLAESGIRECIPGVISRSRIPGNETAAFPEETGTADILAAESSNRSDSEIRMYSKHLTVTRIIAWCVCGCCCYHGTVISLLLVSRCSGRLGLTDAVRGRAA